MNRIFACAICAMAVTGTSAVGQTVYIQSDFSGAKVGDSLSQAASALQKNGFRPLGLLRDRDVECEQSFEYQHYMIAPCRIETVDFEKKDKTGDYGVEVSTTEYLPGNSSLKYGLGHAKVWKIDATMYLKDAASISDYQNIIAQKYPGLGHEIGGLSCDSSIISNTFEFKYYMRHIATTPKYCASLSVAINPDHMRVTILDHQFEQDTNASVRDALAEKASHKPVPAPRF